MLSARRSLTQSRQAHHGHLDHAAIHYPELLLMMAGGVTGIAIGTESLTFP